MPLRLGISLILIYILIGRQKSFSQTSREDIFTNALKGLHTIIDNNGSFESAVALSESIILKENINLNQQISNLIRFIEAYVKFEGAKRYHQPDSLNYKKNNLIFSTFFDSLRYKLNDSTQQSNICLFSYAPDKASEREESVGTLVSKLLATKQGNCHSLSYLYKLIADRIHAKCWLALAPNHIYIKNFSEQYGWYNTELTSRSFPSDAWIMASGYISADAIRSKIYMDTLSNQQSIGLCILDLAKAYEYETKNYYDGFILKCCNLVLQYHSTNPMALLLKAETLKKVYLKQKSENLPTVNQAYADMESAYITLAKLHYREMPKEMYDKWVKQMQEYPNSKKDRSIH